MKLVVVAGSMTEMANCRIGWRASSRKDAHSEDATRRIAAAVLRSHIRMEARSSDDRNSDPRATAVPGHFRRVAFKRRATSSAKGAANFQRPGRGITSAVRV